MSTRAIRKLTGANDEEPKQAQKNFAMDHGLELDLDLGPDLELDNTVNHNKQKINKQHNKNQEHE